MGWRMLKTWLGFENRVRDGILTSGDLGSSAGVTRVDIAVRDIRSWPYGRLLCQSVTSFVRIISEYAAEKNCTIFVGLTMQLTCEIFWRIWIATIRWDATLSLPPSLPPLHFVVFFPSQNGSTALMWAARDSRVDVVMLLLERGAELNAKDSNVCCMFWWPTVPHLNCVVLN